MSIFACLIFMAIAHFSLGCAAPMTEVVATRHSGKIDRSLFEEGKKLWVTYVDEGDTLEIKDRRVVDADESTVTMDGGVKEFDDVTIEYKQIYEISRRVLLNRWFIGVSRRWVHITSFDYGRSYKSFGLSMRYSRFSNLALGMNISKGTEEGHVANRTWTDVDLVVNMYTMLPRTYLYCHLGTGIWFYSKKFDSDRVRDAYTRYLGDGFVNIRFGLGISIPMPMHSNLRLEVGYGDTTHEKWMTEKEWIWL